MNRRKMVTWLSIGFSLVVWVGVALAHITPPVVLVSDREAVVGMTAGASRFFVREVRLTPEKRDQIQTKWGWKPEEDLYRFYLGRDGQGRVVAAVIFLTEITIHGPVRVAVGIRPDGRIQDAKVVELTEETFYWLKPLLDHNLTQEYVGHNSQASFALSGRFAKNRLQSMPHFYGQIVASLIQRAAILFEVAFSKSTGAA
ncbi:MAG: hypothetical protein ACE5HK_01405 [Candidatus Methylomirabilales bacterium]